MDFIYSIDKAVALACSGLDAQVFVAFTYLGEYGLIWIIATLVLLMLPGYRRYGALLGGTISVTFLVTQVLLKGLVQRPRPYVELGLDFLLPAMSDTSFPSGHSAVAFAAATVIFRANRPVGVLAYIVAGLIAASRVILCAHYLSDVIVGALIGLLFGLIAVLLAKKFGWVRSTETRWKKSARR